MTDLYQDTRNTRFRASKADSKSHKRSDRVEALAKHFRRLEDSQRTLESKITAFENRENLTNDEYFAKHNLLKKLHENDELRQNVANEALALNSESRRFAHRKVFLNRKGQKGEPLTSKADAATA